MSDKNNKEEKALMKRAKKAAEDRIKDGTLKSIDKDSYIKGYMRKPSNH